MQIINFRHFTRNTGVAIFNFFAAANHYSICLPVLFFRVLVKSLVHELGGRNVKFIF